MMDATLNKLDYDRMVMGHTQRQINRAPKGKVYNESISTDVVS